MKQFFDTNILIYAIDETAGRKGTIAAECVRVGLQNRTLVVSTQVLQEFVHVAKRKLRTTVPIAMLESLLHQFATRCELTTDLSLIHAAFTRSLQDSVAYYDALIVEGALRTGCIELLSEDLQHERRFGTLTVRNPFL